MGYDDGTVAAFDYIQGKSIYTTKFKTVINKLTCHSQSNIFAFCFDDGTLSVFDYSTKKVLAETQNDDSPVT